MKSKGITLITLVITIIILLILAGITINEIASDNGLLAKTKIARIYSRKSSAEEILKLRIADIQVQNNGTATLQQLLDEFSREEETEIEVIDVVRDEEGILKEIVVKVKEYGEFSFTIGEDLSITKVCNIEYDKWAGETLDTSVEDKKANITIEATPEKQISQYVDEQIVGIKVTSTKKWTNWSGKYSWTISNEIEPTEWKSLTLNEGSTELEKAGEVIGKEDNQGEYYLWVKIETSKQTEIQSFGPYNIQAAPTVENLICEITSKNSDNTEGIVTVGSNKDFEGWTCVYKINDNEEKIIPTGTTTENVVKNDEITVKFKKEGYTDIIKHIQVTELKELYTIIYDFNGGYSGPGTQKQYDNPNFVIPGFATRYEYIFRGWNTNQDGTGTTYNYGDSINLGSSKSITLYAQWEKVEMTCSIATNSNKLTEGTTITLNATSNDEITRVEAYLGDHLIYSEDISSTNYSKTINISDMNNNLKNLEFLKEYTPNIKITVSGAPKRATTSNITNYTVGNATALKTFATTVNNGNALSGEKILQVADITTLSNYIPIGYYDGGGTWTGKPFSGVYKGNNYSVTITSITSETKYKSTGIFGFVIGGEIDNLTARGNNTSTCGFAGGIVGAIKDGIVDNCKNYCELSSTSGKFKGGIAGAINNTTISNCENNKYITGSNAIGGISGGADYSTISNCSNKYTVVSTGYSVETYYNGGSTTSKNYNAASTGGVCGMIKETTITNCENQGVIEGSQVGIGGIVGVAQNSTIQYSQNKKNLIRDSEEYGIIGDSCVGGIVGFARDITTIKSCLNKENIKGVGSGVGGIAGYGTQIGIENAYNRGNVFGPSTAGGIIGNINIGKTASYNNNYIYHVYNTGNISGTSNVGAIAGLYNYAGNDYAYALNGTASKVWGTIGVCDANHSTSNQGFVSTITVPLLGSSEFVADYTGNKKTNDGYPVLSWEKTD